MRELFLDEDRGERALGDYWRSDDDLAAYDAVLAARIEKFGLRLKESTDYDVVNVESDRRYRDFWQTYHQMTERKGVTAQMAKIEMRRRLTLIGSMLLHKGEVDGMICGTWGTTAIHLGYIDQVIGKRAGGSPSTPQDVQIYACMNGLMLPGRQVFLVDTHVNADPAAEELADWCARWATDPAAGDLWADWRAADPRRAERWPERADEALRAGLDALRVPAHAQREELTAHVAALAGWASHLRWRQRSDGDAVLVDGAAPRGMLEAWYGGVWGQQNIFTFAFQMVLILVTGYTLAEAPVLKRAIVRVAAKPNNQVQGALLCFGVSAVLSLLNWGLGLVAGALVARQVAKRFDDAHFGYLIAAAFMAFIVWTQGLSSSIALANTDESSPINVIHKITGMTVPLGQTIFQPYSWLAVIVVLAVLALAIWRMEPSESLPPDPAVFEEEDVTVAEPQGSKTFAEWLENLWILNVLVFAAGMAYFWISGFALNISSMIMLFTITAALLQPEMKPRASACSTKLLSPNRAKKTKNTRLCFWVGTRKKGRRRKASIGQNKLSTTAKAQSAPGTRARARAKIHRANNICKGRPYTPRRPTQFWLAVSTNPAMIAPMKPKSISWLCQIAGLK